MCDVTDERCVSVCDVTEEWCVCIMSLKSVGVYVSDECCVCVCVCVCDVTDECCVCVCVMSLMSVVCVRCH